MAKARESDEGARLPLHHPRERQMVERRPGHASDFVFSFRRIMDPATGAEYASILYPILNAEKINKGQR